MKTNGKPKVIHIHGKRWFQKTYGNTYHSYRIWIDGKFVIKVSGQYGYGEMYLQNATKWLEDNGYLSGLEHYDNGGSEAIWRYCERNEIALAFDVDDVPRQKDL